MIKNFFLAIILLGFFVEANSQSFYKYKRGRDFIASFGTGVSSYFGDLNNPGDVFDTKLNINVGLQYRVSSRLAVRSEVTWFQLEGDDANADNEELQNRNLSFQSNNFEINVVSLIQLFPEGSRYYQRPFFNVYGFAGIGLLNFNPTAEINGERFNLQPIQTEGVDYSRITVVIPYGIGIKLKINPFFNLVAEGGFRQTFTDYIDDVSDVYIDNASFSNPIHAQLADRGPEIGQAIRGAGSTRGNPDRNDSYMLYNLKLEFFLPPQIFGSGKMSNPYKKRRKKARRR